MSEKRSGGVKCSKCQKCGKKLTDPESMARGYGPECWSQITGEPPDSNAKVGDEDEISGQMNIFDFPEYLRIRER